MNMKRAYETLLQLYPADYKARFSGEMLHTLETAPKKRAPAELTGLLIGALKEWIAKLTTDRSVRGRYLPDVRMMRPPGVPQSVWFAAPPPRQPMD
jgi:hypothetical protein